MVRRPAFNHSPTKISYDILLPEIRGALQGTLPYQHQGTSGSPTARFPCLLTPSHLEPAVLRCIHRTRLPG
ncbi:hypothetical protein VDGE_30290 [Verticillium dahliae]|uniref:Uncharacterized protein n=1 Tax=Verticillium dahliae TaxID=27337 RepID=A0A444SB25_VERDA|nr:hypothetical protein VDGE_30290 [Verticillium dahliae]